MRDDEPRERAAAARVRGYVGAGAGVALTTGLGLLLYAEVTGADIAMLYMVAIMLASLAGRGPALLAASLAVAAFDLCFVEPRFTFAVHDQRYLVTFAVMFASGLAISTLTVRLQRQERDAVLRERQTAALLAFTRDVAAVDRADDIAAVAARHLEEMLDADVEVLVPADGDEGALRVAAGRASAASAASAAFEAPLRVGELALGVVRVARRAGAEALSSRHHHLVTSIAGQTGLALGRLRLGAEARDQALRARTEELRSSLLSAVSHDLRTPLAVITGAATSLRDDAAALTAATRAELLDTIVEEAQRLERVLQNLLGITRVETGLVPAREWVPVDELVGAALARLDDVLGDRAVEVDAPADLLVPVDPVLFEHVLTNLVENACKHGASPIRIEARRGDGVIEIDVVDHGPGLPEGGDAHLFEKFYRAPNTRVAGVGLGLAVCRGIVEAHGGSIRAERDAGGGARFRVLLPAPRAPIADAGGPAEHVELRP